MAPDDAENHGKVTKGEEQNKKAIRENERREEKSSLQKHTEKEDSASTSLATQAPCSLDGDESGLLPRSELRKHLASYSSSGRIRKRSILAPHETENIEEIRELEERLQEMLENEIRKEKRRREMIREEESALNLSFLSHTSSSSGVDGVPKAPLTRAELRKRLPCFANTSSKALKRRWDKLAEERKNKQNQETSANTNPPRSHHSLLRLLGVHRSRRPIGANNPLQDLRDWLEKKLSWLISPEL
ncbi:uncharacterized protein LOC122736997 [Dromiciops gliroides]|uniref:uncharacterized protein LOC122736997 n=1 Tax=Dromiciops gliroides TaxID=33562 RepID=UPI001CC703F3|nr:uncharacterized protein LOC122736997 [Dromiciops gliroides]